MCGIVGAVADRNVTSILMEGLRRLEYRGYDSAGIAIIDDSGTLVREREVGKVKELDDRLKSNPIKGSVGISHTRWATHGVPSEANAHPHVSDPSVGVVHNGIIENYERIKVLLEQQGYTFTSETDSEVVAHLYHSLKSKGQSALEAFKHTIDQLEGAYAIALLDCDHPDQLLIAREGSPLVLGVGIEENFVASDQLALIPVTNRFIFLEEGDYGLVKQTAFELFDHNHQPVERTVHELDNVQDVADKGGYKHYMLKEIYEQPEAVQSTLNGRLGKHSLLESALGPGSSAYLATVSAIQIVACGTSYHAGLIAKYWFESIGGVRCDVEIASEFRYRDHVVEPNTALVTISQSGETADTLAALKAFRHLYTGAIAICNVPSSSLVRLSDYTMLTMAGPEIGVASTKAFTTQLVVLLMLVMTVGKQKGVLAADQERTIVEALHALPHLLKTALQLDDAIKELATVFHEKSHALYLGRGTQYPVAMEGALKLKEELSYIHAEAYPAGELKHGPLALVDENMPVVAIATKDELLEKIKSNLQEVAARGGQLYVFAPFSADIRGDNITVLHLPEVNTFLVPVVYTVAMQLLAYHIAVIRGTDVDQPRNLAKSVTVE